MRTCPPCWVFNVALVRRMEQRSALFNAASLRNSLHGFPPSYNLDCFKRNIYSHLQFHWAVVILIIFLLVFPYQEWIFPQNKTILWYMFPSSSYNRDCFKRKQNRTSSSPIIILIIFFSFSLTKSGSLHLIGRVGLWKDFETVCYKMHQVRRWMIDTIYASKLHSFPSTWWTNTARHFVESSFKMADCVSPQSKRKTTHFRGMFVCIIIFYF